MVGIGVVRTWQITSSFCSSSHVGSMPPMPDMLPADDHFRPRSLTDGSLLAPPSRERQTSDRPFGLEFEPFEFGESKRASSPEHIEILKNGWDERQNGAGRARPAPQRGQRYKEIPHRFPLPSLPAPCADFPSRMPSHTDASCFFCFERQAVGELRSPRLGLRGCRVKEKVVKGSNLWEKHNVIINGERIVKVARVSQQVAASPTRLA